MKTFSNINSSGQYVADGTAALAAVSTSAAASTPLSLGTINNISRYHGLMILFSATSALTGGVCDYVLERLMPDSTWDDYCYLGQQAAGAAFLKVVFLPLNMPSAVTEPAAGVLADWTPHTTFGDATIALAAGAARAGHWGRSIRVVSRTGAGVSVAAVTNTYVRAYGE
jgi:hypothetical protein